MTTKVGISLWGKCITTYNLAPDWAFWPFLNPAGLEVVELQSADADYLICFDHYPKVLRDLSKRFPLERRILVVFEPEAVHPIQHRERVRRQYGKVVVAAPRQLILASDTYVRPGTLPSLKRMRDYLSTPVEKKPRSIGFLNENKFSFVPGNLYKHRVDVIKSLTRAGLTVDMGGGTWARGAAWVFWKQVESVLFLIKNRERIDFLNFRLPMRKHPAVHFHGRVPDVVDFFKPFEFALVVENDPNYISEKLLNAVMAGCIPLFVGPPLQEYDLPADLAIAMNLSHESAVKAVKTLTTDQKNHIRSVGRQFILDPVNQVQWSDARYQSEVVEVVAQYCREVSLIAR